MAGENKELKIKFTGDSTSMVEAQRKIVDSATAGAEAEKKLKTAVSETSKELQKAAEVSSARAGSGAKIEALVAKEKERVEIARLVATGQTEIASQLERQLRAAREIKAADIRGGSGLADLVRERQELEDITAARLKAASVEEAALRQRAAAETTVERDVEAALKQRTHDTAAANATEQAAIEKRLALEKAEIEYQRMKSATGGANVMQRVGLPGNAATATAKLTHSNEGLLESEKRVEHQLSGMIRDWALTGSAVDALAISADRLGNTFRTSLGIGVAIAVGVAMKKAIEDAAAEMNKLSDIATDVFKQREGGAKSMEQLRAETVKADAAAEEYQKDITKLEGAWERIKYNASHLSPSDNAASRQREDMVVMDALEKQAATRNDQIAIKEESRVHIAQLIANGYREQADVLLRQIGYAEELDKLDQDRDRNAIAAVRARQQAEEGQIQRQRELHGLERQAGWQTSYGKGTGLNEEVVTAQATYDLKKKQFDLEHSPEAKADLQLELRNAEINLRNTKQRREETQGTLGLEIQKSKMTGDADAIHMATLKAEEELLKKNIAAVIPGTRIDDQAKMRLELQQKQNEITAANEQAAVNAKRGELLESEAGKGFGPTEELQAMQRKFEIERSIYALHSQASKYSQSELDNELTQVNEMGRALKVKQAELEVTNAQLVAEGNILTIEGSHQSEATKRYRITQQQLAAVQAEIKAMGDLNTELAEAARLREQGLKNDLRAQDQSLNFGKSEKDIRKRLRDEKVQQRKEDEWQKKRDDNKGLINPSKDISGNITGGTNPITGEHEDRNAPNNLDPSNFKPKGDQQGPHLKPGQDPAADKAFRDQFKTSKERADEKKAQGAAEAAANKNDGSHKGESPEVAELKAINKKLDKLVLT